MPIIRGSGAHYRGVRCPSQGVQVPIIGGSGSHHRGAGAHYREVPGPRHRRHTCDGHKLRQVPVVAAQVAIYNNI